jgi:hypothetical protein
MHTRSVKNVRTIGQTSSSNSHGRISQERDFNGRRPGLHGGPGGS